MENINRFEGLSEKEKFFTFFTLTKIEDLEELSKGNEVLEKVLNRLKELSMDSAFLRKVERDQIEEYQRRVAIKNEIDLARRNGEEDKINNTARNLLKMKMDINDVSILTGLTVNELKKL